MSPGRWVTVDVGRRNPPLLAACVAAMVLALPFGATGGVVAHALSAAVIIGLGMGQERPLADRLVAFAAFAFTIGHVIKLHDLQEFQLVFMPGYLAMIAVGFIFLRQRARRIETETKADALLAAAVIAFAVAVAREVVPAGRWFPLMTVITGVLVAVFLLGVVGRAGHRRARLFNLATIIAMGLGAVETRIPIDRYALLFTIPNLPLVAYMADPDFGDDDKVVAPLSATRPFGWAYRGYFLVLLCTVPAAVLLLSDRTDADLRPIALIGLVTAVAIVYRIHLMVSLRDWSHRQEMVLRHFGDGIIGVEDQAELDRMLAETILLLIGDEGTAAVLGATGDNIEVRATMPTIAADMKPTKDPFRLGDVPPSVERWLDTVPNGPTVFSVHVPGLQDDRYLVGIGARPLRADVEGHLRSAAVKYGLAVSAIDLAEALRRSTASQHYNALTQDSQDLVMTADPETLEVKFISITGRRLLRLASGSSPTGSNVLSVFHHVDHRLVRRMIRLARASGEAVTNDIRHALGDGSFRWFQLTVRDAADDTDLDGMLLTSSDIHDRKTSEMEVRLSERRYRALVQNSTDVSLLVDENTAICYISPNVRSCFGFDEADLAGTKVVDLLRSDQVDTFVGACGQVLSDGAAAELELKLVPHPSIGADELTVEVLISDAELGEDPRLVVLMRDVTVKRQMEQSLKDQALYDTTTNLLTRAAFVHALHRELKSLPPTAALMIGSIDFENHRAISRQEGYATGDRACVELAARLTAAVREDDVLARLSADQFGFICRVESRRKGEDMARRLRLLLDDSVVIDGREHSIGARFGITFCTDRRANPQALIQQAALSAGQHDQSGDGGVVVFEPSMQDEANERFEIARDLRFATQSNQLELVYQPIVATCDGNVTGFEALARWNHPTKGLIAPKLFIDLAEENGSIVDLGRWVMGRACARLASWQSSSGQMSRTMMDVNVSPSQLAKDGELERLIETIVASGLDPTKLTVELTESIVISDTVRLQSQLREMRALGVAIAIDDFGTGVAGLAHLRDFPFDLLKIDKSYVDPLIANEESRMLVRGIVELAHDMGAVAVAEGVENAQQFDLLAELGCDLIQGFHFARPMPEEDLIEWMAGRQVTEVTAKGRMNR